MSLLSKLQLPERPSVFIGVRLSARSVVGAGLQGLDGPLVLLGGALMFFPWPALRLTLVNWHLALGYIELNDG